MGNLFIEEILPLLRGVSICSAGGSASLRIWEDGNGSILDEKANVLRKFNSVEELEQIITGEKDAENHQTATEEKSSEEADAENS